MSKEQPDMLSQDDIDVAVTLPPELTQIVAQGLVNLRPWHIMPRDLAKKRLTGLRARYRKAYVPFARRQDNDDVACFDPDLPGQIVVVHDFSSDGSERVSIHPSFWDWFRRAIEDMISFE